MSEPPLGLAPGDRVTGRYALSETAGAYTFAYSGHGGKVGIASDGPGFPPGRLSAWPVRSGRSRPALPWTCVDVRVNMLLSPTTWRISRRSCPAEQ
jgi:hypothetical protein